ncbi:hypothetical protein [Jeongeupia naejangsanensis]|uniref:Uncharacterized protein n=1 Tax=Jeongeupia naejangsanensis TaxID=613195 RepID=A0ABS2BGA3_9NEIS|nr:hypothetical protein [Jeongeupia naejangsanensis]MBM3114490.1 hypothetical protein [Jeongeupia naejangsanensis]
MPLRRLVPALFALALSACASIDATSTQYVGVAHPAPTDPASVQILREEPKKPFDRIGEVKIDASTDPAPGVTEVEDKLRAEAAKLGADAVVIVYDRIQPVGAYVSGPYWAATVQDIEGHRLIGIAIKYR